ncbi:hypothetical protein LY78DRAFT_271480 [Colletotrichum sublineola]|nr:hypothetical protein LY78DRAFT_271480 [Colletotrichum sublineola]
MMLLRAWWVLGFGPVRGRIMSASFCSPDWVGEGRETVDITTQKKSRQLVLFGRSGTCSCSREFQLTEKNPPQGLYIRYTNRLALVLPPWSKFLSRGLARRFPSS